MTQSPRRVVQGKGWLAVTTITVLPVSSGWKLTCPRRREVARSAYAWLVLSSHAVLALLGPLRLKPYLRGTNVSAPVDGKRGDLHLCRHDERSLGCQPDSVQPEACTQLQYAQSGHLGQRAAAAPPLPSEHHGGTPQESALLAKGLREVHVDRSDVLNQKLCLAAEDAEGLDERA